MALTTDIVWRCSDLWALWVGLAMGFRGTLGFGVWVERRSTQNSEICTKWLSEVVVKGLKDLPPKLFEQCWAWYFTVECGYCREISGIQNIQSPWVIAQLTSTQWSESGNLSKLALSRVWDLQSIIRIQIKFLFTTATEDHGMSNLAGYVKLLRHVHVLFPLFCELTIVSSFEASLWTAFCHFASDCIWFILIYFDSFWFYCLTLRLPLILCLPPCFSFFVRREKPTPWYAPAELAELAKLAQVRSLVREVLLEQVAPLLKPSEEHSELRSTLHVTSWTTTFWKHYGAWTGESTKVFRLGGKSVFGSCHCFSCNKAHEPGCEMYSIVSWKQGWVLGVDGVLISSFLSILEWWGCDSETVCHDGASVWFHVTRDARAKLELTAAVATSTVVQSELARLSVFQPTSARWAEKKSHNRQ